MDAQHNKSINELNEDCDILIKKEIQKYLVNYASGNEVVKRGHREGSGGPEMQQLYFSPFNRLIEMRERCPKMLPSPSATMSMNGQTRQNIVAINKSFSEKPKIRRLVDAPIQATDEKYMTIPRSTVLSRTRQHLSKRNSGSQSLEIRHKTVKTQTENCAKNSISVNVEPLDFIGMYEKATNVPAHNNPGVTKEQCTQMYEHITQSELFCIEWIHKNLFEVKLSPNTLVVDDKLRDHSESACVT